MKIEELNQLSAEEFKVAIEKCCHSKRFAEAMLKKRPYPGITELISTAEEEWFKLEEADLFEAFEGHSRIGDLGSLKKKFASTRGWAEKEQGAVRGADENTLKELAEWNLKYEEKFHFLFLICATGKPAEVMLEAMKERLQNSKNEEIKIAFREQNKITKLRLEKLLESPGEK